VASALSKFLGTSPEDEEDVYDVIQEMYRSRSRVVHGARQLDPKAYMQSVALARTAFMGVVINSELPLTAASSTELQTALQHYCRTNDELHAPDWLATYFGFPPAGKPFLGAGRCAFGYAR